MTDARRAAEEILAQLKHTYATSQTIVPANEAEFTHLDLSRYRAFRDTLEREGYHLLSDFEVLEITNAPGTIMARTMVRAMASADGGTCAAYYQVRPRMGRVVANLLVGLLNLRLIDAPRFFLHVRTTKHCYDFTSEVGGTFVTTSNAADAAMMTAPPTIDALYFPYDTALDTVRLAHVQRLAAAVARMGHAATRIGSNEDMLAMEERLRAQKNAHRAMSNWITQQELQALSGGDTLVAELVWEELQKLQQGQQQPEVRY